MNEVSIFVYNAIANGVIGSSAYESIKLIIGSGFEKLSGLMLENKNQVFQEELMRIIKSKNIEDEIKLLIEKESYEDSLVEIDNSTIEINSKGSIDFKGSVRKIKNSTIKIN